MDAPSLQHDRCRGVSRSIGKFAFKAGDPGGVTLSTRNANGIVITDGVAFVKVAEKQ
jgi:hypothetical protein